MRSRTPLLLFLLCLSLCVTPSVLALSLSGAGGGLPTVSCPDTGGNHLNFSGGVWTCGVSSSGGAPGNAKADSTTKGIATFPATQFTDNGSGLLSLVTPYPVAYGGTNLTTAPDDNVMLGNGTTWQLKALPDCQDAGGNHLNYTASTNTIACGTSGGTGGGGTLSTSGSPGVGQAAEFTDATHVQGVAVSGTGSYLKQTSAILITPQLGTPTSVTLTNA